jgi:hypothetical protein
MGLRASLGGSMLGLGGDGDGDLVEGADEEISRLDELDTAEHAHSIRSQTCSL